LGNEGNKRKRLRQTQQRKIIMKVSQETRSLPGNLPYKKVMTASSVVPRTNVSEEPAISISSFMFTFKQTATLNEGKHEVCWLTYMKHGITE
jgi:hypothetical protein